MTDPAFTPALGRPEWTGFYDLAIALLTREKTWRRALIDQLDPHTNEAILDVGCGTGSLLVQIARSVPRSILTGLDPDTAILERARAKTIRRGATIDFVQGFAEDADRAGGPFDKITSSLVFHQVPIEGKRAGFVAIWKALKPGGALHVADYGLQRTPLMRRLFRQVQRLDGFENTEPNARGVLPELITAAGFVDVEERQVIPTLTGSISIYRALKPI